MLQTPDASLSAQAQIKLDKSQPTNAMRLLESRPVRIPAFDRRRETRPAQVVRVDDPIPFPEAHRPIVAQCQREHK